MCRNTASRTCGWSHPPRPPCSTPPIHEVPLSFSRTFLAAALLTALAPIHAADDKTGHDQSTSDHAAGMDPAVMELMKPGPEHQPIMAWVGTWDVACKMWMKPNTPPMESKGTATFESILNGHFVEEKYVSELMGRPFHGRSVLGYDRAAKQYVCTWYDSMGTGITYLTGTSGDGGRTIATRGDMTCPIEGKIAVRMVETHQSNDRVLIEMFQTKDQTESKTMELAYSRRK